MMKEKEYEITGMPAPWHFKASRDEVAILAVLVLGEGTLGLVGLSDKSFEFPVCDLRQREELIKKLTGMPEKKLLAAIGKQDVMVQVLSALRSIEYGRPGETPYIQPTRAQDIRYYAASVCRKLLKEPVRQAHTKQEMKDRMKDEIRLIDLPGRVKEDTQ